jgi:hypothetical protein
MYLFVCLDTYSGNGWLRNMLTFLRAFAAFLGLLVGGNVDLIHIHSASCGSFYRKSLFLLGGRLFRKPVLFHLRSFTGSAVRSGGGSSGGSSVRPARWWC